MLRIGQIEYANCTPLFHALRQVAPSSEYSLISGVPAVLNGKLLSGEIDLCPSSSIEYAYHPERYRILPGLSISSRGAVASVLLFSSETIENLDGRKVLLSSESATSVNLLKILLEQRYDCRCVFQVSRNSLYSDNEASALLLIGDSALRTHQAQHGRHVYDLGELWYQWTGLPFVFALWLCRTEIADDEELKIIGRSLVHAKERVPELLERIAASDPVAEWMGYERLLRYWRENISYHLDDSAQAGLRLYYEKCFECKLIDVVPDVRFVSL